VIDTHCHLDFPEFDADRDQVVHQCLSRGVKRIIVPGVTAASWPRLHSIVQRYEFCEGAYGMHPLFMNDHSLEHLDLLNETLQDYDACAVGEIGLDYYLPNHDREAQARLLAGQLQLAKQHRLPVILHIRKAHEDALSMLKQFKLDAGGSVHAFNGSYEQAQRYMDLGFKFGFGGAVTYDAATKLRRTLKNLPDDSLLLETDAPDMAPAMYPSKRNNPAYLPDILAVIAEIRETDPMELVRITDRNAEQLFLHTSELRNHQV